MPSQKIQMSVSIPDLAKKDILQIRTADGKFYTIEMICPETGEANLQKEKTKKVRGRLLGSLSPDTQIHRGEVRLGCRVIFSKLPGEDIQALRITQKVWLNHELVLHQQEA